LRKKPIFKNELTVNPNQGKTLDRYLELLRNAFKQTHEALKPKKYLTVVLHEEDREILEKCIKSVMDVGFDLVKEEETDGFNIFTFQKLQITS
jgi:hypothetical protein